MKAAGRQYTRQRFICCALFFLLVVFAAAPVPVFAQQSDTDETTSLETAHARYVKSGDIQTELQRREPVERPDRDIRPNGFWETVGNFIKALAPLFKLFFWIGVPILVLLILFTILREATGFTLPGAKNTRRTGSVDIGYRPDEHVARTLLQDADALAERGEYEAAARLLLTRSIEDIEMLRSTQIERSLTSREIEQLETIPNNARPAFSIIAEIVEHSVFAGQSLTQDGFMKARSAYEQFALLEAWR